MDIYLTILLLIALSLWTLHLYLTYNRKKALTKDIRGPPSLWIFGNVHHLHVPLTKLNETLNNLYRKYYPCWKIVFFNLTVVLIYHPDDIEILLSCTKNINKGYGYEIFRSWLKSGLLVSMANKWHHRRKILTPAFHFNILKKYLDITNERGDKIIADTRAKGKELDIEVLSFSAGCTLDIICETTMGVSISDSSYKEDALKYKEAIHKMGYIMCQRVTKPYLKDWVLPFFRTLYNEQTKALKDLDHFTNVIVKDRRDYHLRNNYKDLKGINEGIESENDNIYLGTKKKRLAMLDLLLALERDGLIDDAGIKEEVATFILAGYDTSAVALHFIILVMAENKDAQDKVRREVEPIFSRNGGKLEISDFQKMNYLERCIKESMRLFPSVPMIGRVITEDIQLKHCFLPRGCDTFIRIQELHRNPDYWPEPNKFNPDRFLPEEIRKRHPFAYLPFSAGSRNCLGQKFAMMEMKSLVAKLLYNFYLEPIDYASDIKILSDLVLRTDKTLYVKFLRIDRK